MKKKLTALFLIISVVPMLLLASIFYQMFETKITGYLTDLGLANLKNIQLEVTQLLKRNQEGIKLLAQNPAVRQFDLPNAHYVMTGAKEKVFPDIMNIIVDNTEGLQVLRSDSPPTAKFTTSVGARAYFKEAMQGKNAISDATLAVTTKQLSVILATPIYENNSSSKIVGAMHASLSLKTLSEFVSKFSRDGRVAYIIDNGGKIIAHPDEQKIVENNSLKEVPYVEAGLDGKTGMAQYVNQRNERRIVYYMPETTTGWLLCYEIPYEELAAQLNMVRYTAGGILIFMIILMSILGMVIANKLVKPMERLAIAAEKVSQGDLTVRVDIGANDEIGRMARSFNMMVSNLCSIIQGNLKSTDLLADAAQQLAASANQAALAADQVATTITEVAQGADKQSRISNETTSIVEEMSAGAQDAAANAASVAQAAERTSQAAKDGSETIKKSGKPNDSN